MESRFYKPGEMASLVGVTVKTLQRWDREGVLPAKRTLTGKRYYTIADVNKVLSSKH